MKKLYYDCPIASAYMAKHFLEIYPDKPIFIWNNKEFCSGGDLLAFFTDFTENYKYWDWDSYKPLPIYIHPDSLPIFEPREGDLVQINDGVLAFRCVKEIPEGYGEDGIISLSKLRHFKKVLKEQRFKIIQRDNKPFITPKCEEL